jgi:cysteine synthase A
MNNVNIKTKSTDQEFNTSEFRGRTYADITQTIGATPLVELSRLKEKHKLKANILAKLEFFNPIGSVKDRIALSMIEEAERAGKITPGKTVIVEPTSGNTGIGLASIAARKGYKLILTMPDSMSVERRAMLKIMGAELVLTPAEEGIKGSIAKAEEIMSTYNDAFMPSQFSNPANPKIHEQTTGPEIWHDTDGTADIFISGVGTGGTITGVGRYMKEKKPSFKVIAVEPEDSPVLSGGEHTPHKIQGIGAGFVPDILETDLIDEIITISNDLAITNARELACLEGIPVGISAGAAIAAAIKAAKQEENEGKNIIVIIPSFAERYLSTVLFEDL